MCAPAPGATSWPCQRTPATGQRWRTRTRAPCVGRPRGPGPGREQPGGSAACQEPALPEWPPSFEGPRPRLPAAARPCGFWRRGSLPAPPSCEPARAERTAAPLSDGREDGGGACGGRRQAPTTAAGPGCTPVRGRARRVRLCAQGPLEDCCPRGHVERMGRGDRPVGTGQQGAFRDSGGHTARKGQVHVSTGASALRAPWRRWASASARGGPQAVFPGGCAAVAPALAAAVSSQRQGAGGSRGPTLRVQGGPSPVQQQSARDRGLRRHFQICTVDCEST